MGIVHYLAMTAAEYRSIPELPKSMAWMACFFSPYGKGLSNLPRSLPPGALLMVSDITPIHGHSREWIGQQLLEQVEALSCYGVLLDFQRPGYGEAADLAAYLTAALPCPVGVAQEYARPLDCPVLLPPLPCHMRLSDYLSPWKNREIWLETALGGELLTLTEEGCTISVLSDIKPSHESFHHQDLNCRYRIQDQGDRIEFPLWRTREDHHHLLKQAEDNGVTLAVGLYQEFSQDR